ncbi:unnamed protein product [Somion occarium]|uniref:Uncharacterized protein n=1 Tax=Somion occarium TaxID=3059160 RepID=A0ABP1E6Y1_9APHY
MPMPFPFSFSFSVPGIPNPFSSSAFYRPVKAPYSHSESVHSSNDKHDKYNKPEAKVGPIRRRAPSPCLSSSQPLSRKRGWVPSISEPSQAAAIPTSTSGYLDTPAKYRDMAQSHEDDEIEEMVGDIPAPKRRKTLAGSIVSTALSAALIGTAVGLTVYRLWRNRGRQPEALPPPPYEQGEWVPKPEGNTSPVPETKVTPATPRSKKPQYVAGRRTVPRHRKTPSRSHVHTHTLPRGVSPPRHALIPDAFTSGPDETEPHGEVDEQMDWMSDRLNRLIEEGKRALGKEIVVMSEAQEDEVDDGSGAWIEDELLPTSSSTGSMRRGRTRPRHAPLPSFSPLRGAHTPSPQSSPRKKRFDVSYSRQVTESPRRPGRGISVESDARSFVTTSHREDEEDLISAEAQEAMERARMLYRQRQQHS